MLIALKMIQTMLGVTDECTEMDIVKTRFARVMEQFRPMQATWERSIRELKEDNFVFADDDDDEDEHERELQKEHWEKFDTISKVRFLK